MTHSATIEPFLAAAARKRFRFPVEMYERFVADGVLTEQYRVEMIDGEIVDKTTIGDRHAGCVTFLNAWCHRTIGARATIGVQSPIRLPTSVPEPDLSVARPRPDYYRSGKPRPEDLSFLVEVADDSVAYDRHVIGRLYAVAGIPEYWVVDLPHGLIWVHRGPQADGEWTTVEDRGVGDAVGPRRTEFHQPRPSAFPDAVLPMGEALARPV